MSRLKQIRLVRELEEMIRLASSPLIDFTSEGSPPRLYYVTLYSRGLRWNKKQSRPQTIEQHQFSLRLGSSYPSDPPDVTWLTPIFHPNIRREAVCHSNQWSPTWTLADFVCELNDMIRFKKYNIYSPLDLQAASWAQEHEELFPVDPRGLRETSPQITVRPRES